MANVGYQYVNDFTESTIAEHMRFLHVTQPPDIVVVGAGQYPQALGFAKAVVAAPWQTEVIFRDRKRLFDLGFSGADNGIHNHVTPDYWYSQVGRYYAGSGLIPMPDNEGFSPNYGKWTGGSKGVDGAIQLAAKDGMQLAVGAFSTHNPHRTLWYTLLPMFEALLEHGGKFVPHIYYSDSPSVKNDDGFQHVLELLGYVCKELTVPMSAFDVVITEFGRAYNPDGKALQANRGYVSDGIGQGDYARELLDRKKEFIDDKGWKTVVFSKGSWPTGGRNEYGVGKDFDKVIEENAEPVLPVVPPTKPDRPIVPPVTVDPFYPALPAADDSRWVEVMLSAVDDNGEAATRTNIRTVPNAVGNTPIAQLIGPGNLVEVIEDSGVSGWWMIKTLYAGKQVIGWISSDYVRIDLSPPEGVPAEDRPGKPTKPPIVIVTQADLLALSDLVAETALADKESYEARQRLYKAANLLLSQLSERMIQ